MTKSLLPRLCEHESCYSQRAELCSRTQARISHDAIVRLSPISDFHLVTDLCRLLGPPARHEGPGAKKESLVLYGNSTENPQVSIIIPAKNEAKGIESIIGRVRKALDESGRSYEILVVDDGSTDGTAVRAYEAGATVLCHPYNIGNGAAVKTGIRYARGGVPRNARCRRPAPARRNSRPDRDARNISHGSWAARFIFGNEFSPRPGKQDLQPVCLIRVRPRH